MYSASDFQALIEEFARTADGQQLLREQGAAQGSSVNAVAYTPAEMSVMANALKTDVIAAYQASLMNSGGSFAGGAVKVGRPREHKDGTYQLSIDFPASALYRRSLLPTFSYSKKQGKRTFGFTGSGIQDVFAMITTGYHARARVYGEWLDHDGSGDGIGMVSLKDRNPHPFVPGVVEAFVISHPNVQVDFPEEWGGGTTRGSHYYYIKSPWAPGWIPGMG